MRRIGESKRGLSNLVAYVLLIAITISLSVMVYGWLKFYVADENVPMCSDNVEVIINSYKCINGPNGSLTINLKNKGLFDVDGFMLRVHDRVDADFGIYVFDADGSSFGPGEEYTMTYDFEDYNDANPGVNLDEVTLIDIQPYLLDDDDKVACNAYASQRVVCFSRFVYDGFDLGESFYDLEASGSIILSGASCLGGTNQLCKIWGYPCGFTFKTPGIPVAGRYNVTYNVELSSAVSYENYTVLCGGGSSSFSDDNGIDGRTNVSVVCDFSMGVNDIVFETVGTTGPADIEFYYLKIEGPVI